MEEKDTDADEGPAVEFVRPNEKPWTYQIISKKGIKLQKEPSGSSLERPEQSTGKEVVHVRGATGDYARYINGIFEPGAEVISYMNKYDILKRRIGKKEDPDVWLRQINDPKPRWVFCSSPDEDTTSMTVYAYSAETGLSDPTTGSSESKTRNTAQWNVTVEPGQTQIQVRDKQSIFGALDH